MFAAVLGLLIGYPLFAVVGYWLIMLLSGNTHDVLGLLIGYPLFAFVGYWLIMLLSGNTHDRCVEPR